MAPPRKKRATQKSSIEDRSISIRENGINDFAKLPLEMHAEILSYTSSPDILSLARTSRFFFDILVVNPWSVVIWKKARQRFQPLPIPTPLPNWTEVSYIAFICDPGPCETCGKMTKSPPYSYALRARLCRQPECTMTWKSHLIAIPRIGGAMLPAADLPHIRAIQTWMPYHDYRDASTSLYRPRDWNIALQRHKDAMLDLDRLRLLQQEYAKKTRLLPIIMEFHENFKEWSAITARWQVSVSRENRKLLEDNAIANGWELPDFRETQLYKTLIKTRDDMSEKLTTEDYLRVQDEFEEQVAECRKRRIAALIDSTTRSNRQDLRSYWNSLKTAKKGPVPAYAEFRRLSMARILELKNTDNLTKEPKQTVRQELKHNASTRNHLTREINVWLNDLRAKLSDKIKVVHPELAVTAGYQHPVERVNAWFICTMCKDKANPMDFKQVCGHRCRGLTDKEKSSDAWDAAWFEADKKAIAAGNELLRVSALDEKLVSTHKKLMALGARFLCKTCPSPIVMDALSVIRHARRHDNMTVELLTSEDAKHILNTPFQPGIAAKLMARSKAALKARQRAEFVCRHCQDVKKRFNFDGLRSHLKVIHSITDVGDEDFEQDISQ